MHNLAHHRSTAASGAVFAVMLFVANGQGGSLAPWREVAASAAVTLLVAFAAYLAVLVRLRSRGPVDDWLATTIVERQPWGPRSS